MHLVLDWLDWLLPEDFSPNCTVFSQSLIHVDNVSLHQGFILISSLGSHLCLGACMVLLARWLGRISEQPNDMLNSPLTELGHHFRWLHPFQRQWESRDLHIFVIIFPISFVGQCWKPSATPWVSHYASVCTSELPLRAATNKLLELESFSCTIRNSQVPRDLGIRESQLDERSEHPPFKDFNCGVSSSPWEHRTTCVPILPKLPTGLLDLFLVVVVVIIIAKVVFCLISL